VGVQDAVRLMTGTLEQSVRPVSVSLNCTVEVGVAIAENGSVRTAVNETGTFTTEVACEECTAMVRVAGLTFCTTMFELDPKFVSPPYAAVTV